MSNLIWSPLLRGELAPQNSKHLSYLNCCTLASGSHDGMLVFNYKHDINMRTLYATIPDVQPGQGIAMLPEITREELSTILDIVAAETLAAAGFLQPPVDALHVAQISGLTVAWDDRQSGRARLVALASGADSAAQSILLKHDPRQERLQWAVAHEIGGNLTPRIFDQLGIDVRHAAPQAREQVANSFAARLLLPGDWFSTDGASCGWDLIELKQRYETASHELIARRMLDLLVPVIISVYDQDRLTWRKSNLTGRQPPPCRREIECRSRAHKNGETDVDRGPPLIYAWAVHEPDRKREIVRMEIDEFAWESRDD